MTELAELAAELDSLAEQLTRDVGAARDRETHVRVSQRATAATTLAVRLKTLAQGPPSAA